MGSSLHQATDSKGGREFRKLHAGHTALEGGAEGSSGCTPTLIGACDHVRQLALGYEQEQSRNGLCYIMGTGRDGHSGLSGLTNL